MRMMTDTRITARKRALSGTASQVMGIANPVAVCVPVTANEDTKTSAGIIKAGTPGVYNPITKCVAWADGNITRANVT